MGNDKRPKDYKKSLLANQNNTSVNKSIDFAKLYGEPRILIDREFVEQKRIRN